MSDEKGLEADAPQDVSRQGDLQQEPRGLGPNGKEGHGEKTTSNRSSATLSAPEADHATEPPKPSTSGVDPASFPDGGLEAWLAVLGGFMALFVSFGWINCIGTFQDYYQTRTLKNYSSSTVAWIPSLETFMMYSGGPWVGRLYDNYGPRYLVLTGTFLHVFGLMMLSISKSYYQIILAQGICSPLGCSMLFFPSLSATSTWFFRKRAMAIGIMVSGASLGGVVLPIMIERLINEVGFGWTLRIVAFLILGCLVVTNLTLKSRITPVKRPVKAMDFFSGFKELPYLFTVAGSFCTFWGLFLPFNYIVLQARQGGMSQRLAQYMLPLMNASGVPGRILPPLVSDSIGRFNVMVIMSTLTAASVLAIWIPSTSNAPIIVFAIVYGCLTGAVVALPAALIAQISDVRQIGTRVGSLYAVGSISALTGNPIGGALVTAQGGRFQHMQIYTGLTMMAGAAFFAAARTSLAGFDFKKRV